MQQTTITKQNKLVIDAYQLWYVEAIELPELIILLEQIIKGR